MDEPWRLHEESTRRIQAGCRIRKCPNVAICDEKQNIIVYVPSGSKSYEENGTAIIRNFLYKVCGAVGDWTIGKLYCMAVSKKSEAK